jgi:peptidoglycan/LPS O-acetylase OafA/YrhL
MGPLSSVAPDNSARPAYIPELDGVRGIAIAMVMALHFIASQAPEPQNAIERLAVSLSGYGMWGVDLFFVLSGYLITGLLWDSRGSPRYFSGFYMRRTLRIFPLYFGVLFVLTVLLPRDFLAANVPDALGIRDVQGWLWTYLANVYVALKGDFVIPYVSHFWTLAIEEHFYLLWPLVVRIASRGVVIRVAIALSLSALCARLVLAWTTDNHMWAHAFTLCRLDSLCIGAFFALWIRGPGGADVLKRAVTILPLLGVSLLVLMVLRFDGALQEASLALKQFLLAILVAILISTAAWTSGWRPMRKALCWSPLVFLGKYSYGLYVFHGIIAYYLLHHGGVTYFSALSGSHTAGLFLQALFGITLSLLVAVASYHAFEAPFLRLKRYFRS